MAWATQYIIANAALVNQTWNRTKIGDDYAKYVNDTARASGIEEFFELKRQNYTKGTGTSKISGGRWNFKFSTRTIATEVEPMTFSCTVSLTDTLAGAVTTARAHIKDARLVLVDLTNTDPEIDDVSGTRVM